MMGVGIAHSMLLELARLGSAWLGFSSINPSSNIYVSPPLQGSGYGVASAAARRTWWTRHWAKQGRNVRAGAV